MGLGNVFGLLGGFVECPMCPNPVRILSSNSDDFQYCWQITWHSLQMTNTSWICRFVGFSKIASNLILFDSSHQNKKLVLGTRTRFLALTKLPKQCLIIYRISLELSFCLPTCVVSSLKKFPWDYLWCGGNHAHPSLMGRLSGPLSGPLPPTCSANQVNGKKWTSSHLLGPKFAGIPCEVW